MYKQEKPKLKQEKAIKRIGNTNCDQTQEKVDTLTKSYTGESFLAQSNSGISRKLSIEPSKHQETRTEQPLFLKECLKTTNNELALKQKYTRKVVRSQKFPNKEDVVKCVKKRPPGGKRSYVRRKIKSLPGDQVNIDSNVTSMSLGDKHNYPIDPNVSADGKVNGLSRQVFDEGPDHSLEESDQRHTRFYSTNKRHSVFIKASNILTLGKEKEMFITSPVQKS